MREQNIPLPTDYKKAVFTIEGKQVSVVDLQRPSEKPLATSEVRTFYFGNDARHDFNGDRVDDVVFLVQRYYADGSILYYVVTALSQGSGYVGSEGYLLGDRIAPQTTEIRDNDIVVVNYAERKLGEKITTQPSVGKSAMLKLDITSRRWGIVAQNFEGEADPRLMTLSMKPWKWVSARYNNGQTVAPQKADAFVLTFTTQKTFSATTDCNGVGGSSVIKGLSLSMSDMIATQMFCPNAEEGLFTELLGLASSYRFTSKGELIIELKNKSGEMYFR